METSKNGSQGLIAPKNDDDKGGFAVSRSDASEARTPLGSGTNSPYRVLTTITNSPSAQAQKSRSATVLRFALQAKARDLLPDHRVGWCMRRFRGETARVGIVHAKARGSSYFDGLMRCGRVWVCAVCAAKISETRRVELTDLLLDARIAVHHGEGETANFYPRWFLTMLTFTIQHKPEESAAAVLLRLDLAWKRYTSGRWIQDFRGRFWVCGTLRALEMTHGAQGWHPHFHLLQFHKSVLRERNGLVPDANGVIDGYPSLPEMIGSAQIRWAHSAASVAGYADALHGVELTVGDIAKYPIKSDAERELKRWGMTSEVTKQTVKRGKKGEQRSMTDLLIDAAKGDDLAAAFWQEGTAALEGHKQLEPSKGLWLMLGRKLKSEAEAAEDEPKASDEVLALLSWSQWKAILLADARGDVLDIASQGDPDALWAYLGSLGVHRD